MRISAISRWTAIPHNRFLSRIGGGVSPPLFFLHLTLVFSCEWPGIINPITLAVNNLFFTNNDHMTLYFYFSVVLLALLLFFPVNKLIWVMSVRRLQKKQQQELSTQEINGQKTRSRFIALILVIIFSWFFNLQLLGTPNG